MTQNAKSLSEPRHAASLLVVSRNEGDGPRLLMARRSASHRFMPNTLVFPGGAVDEADYHAPAATHLRPEIRARLERSAAPELAHALAMAAARELEEEVGLSLGRPPWLGELDYLCRAITPPDRTLRFDARFFLVQADRVTGTMAASSEMESPGWYTLPEALAGDIPLATRAVLGQFERWMAGANRDGAVPVLRDRVWQEE